MPKTVLLADNQEVVAKEEIAGLREIGTKFAKKTVELEEFKNRLKAAPTPDAVTPSRIFAKARDGMTEKQGPWKCMAHQMEAIKKMAQNRATDDERRWLQVDTPKIMQTYLEAKGFSEDYIAKATGTSEAVGPDGGFLLAPQYAEGVLEIAHDFDNLLDKCDKYEMAAPSLKMRAIDETSLATTRRGGVLGYWIDEAGTLVSSKPKFRQIELTAHKVTVLTYGTEELLQDAPMAEQYFSRYAAEELTFQTNDAIVNGTGAGKPLGVLNAACLISVSKETGQAATTIVTENVVKMFARLHSGSRGGAVWLVNQDTLPQLHTMTLGVGTGGVVTFMPPGGVSGAPYATLYGKPVIEIPWCATLGTVGDILLVDLKAYIAATRGSVLASNSIHVAFLTDEVAFKWTFRVAGQPWWNAALTPFKGTNTQSPFIALATRS
jgi:HK97 family phage major capsid protein